MSEYVQLMQYEAKYYGKIFCASVLVAYHYQFHHSSILYIKALYQEIVSMFYREKKLLLFHFFLLEKNLTIFTHKKTFYC